MLFSWFLPLFVWTDANIKGRTVKSKRRSPTAELGFNYWYTYNTVGHAS
jgi:hypothetical protein